jgi:hypothetical protein
VIDRAHRRAALIATAVTLPLVVVLALVLGDTSTHSAKKPATPGNGPLPAITVTPPPSDAAAAAPCTKLLQALPVQLDGLPSRPALSSSPYVVAWGEPAVVLRCGVPRPAGLVPGSSALLPGIDGVFYWHEQKSGKDVYTSVDRAVYVEVSVPTHYASAPMPAVSDAIAKALPAVCEVSSTETDVSKLCTHRP